MALVIVLGWFLFLGIRLHLSYDQMLASQLKSCRMEPRDSIWDALSK
jgi:hypothetical protein